MRINLDSASIKSSIAFFPSSDMDGCIVEYAYLYLRTSTSDHNELGVPGSLFNFFAADIASDVQEFVSSDQIIVFVSLTTSSTTFKTTSVATTARSTPTTRSTTSKTTSAATTTRSTPTTRSTTSKTTSAATTTRSTPITRSTASKTTSTAATTRSTPTTRSITSKTTSTATTSRSTPTTRPTTSKTISKATITRSTPPQPLPPPRQPLTTNESNGNLPYQNSTLFNYLSSNLIFDCKGPDRVKQNLERSLCRTVILKDRFESMDPELEHWLGYYPAVNRTEICIFLREEKVFLQTDELT
ncbi:unnamed protein product [Orchesella dallaii]|uniref:Uncharacterized protein n=1 Tax=Orchesella dallaii TaxID=48710 RepID=A0ABP1RP23_9HEXA